MKIYIALSRKQMGELYHYTQFKALLNILETGKLALSTGRGISVEQKHASGKTYFASFTRSRFGGYHYKHGEAGKYGQGAALITLDGEALTNRYKFAPIDYWERRGATDPNEERNKEYEERLLTNVAEIPILQYIKRVDFIVPASLLDSYKNLMGTTKTELVKNEREGQALGSVILRLKKNKIPYSFYNHMQDWAKRTGEISYLAPKKVSVVGKAERWEVANKKVYQHLANLVVCLTDKPYEELTKSQKDIAYQLYAYPRDADSVFNDYESNRKPDAHPELRAMAQKLARVMQRLGFGIPEAAEFIKKKYLEYDRREQEARDQRIAEQLAEELLQLYDGNFDAVKAAHNPLRSILYKEPYGYLQRETAEYVRKALAAKNDDAKRLAGLVKTAGGATDFVAELRAKLISAGIEMEY